MPIRKADGELRDGGGPILRKAIQFQIFVLILSVFVQASFVDAQIKHREIINGHHLHPHPAG
jgi:hypothetical protein